MNVVQLAKQLRYLLRAHTWPGGSVVFGSVHVTNGLPEEEYGLLRMPACLLSIGDSESDGEDPDYVKQNFMISYMANVAGDMRGENPLLGANRPSGNTSSRGRGVLELDVEVSRLLRQVQETSGVKMLAKRRSTPEIGKFADLGYVALRSMLVEAKCTDALYYHPPRRVAGSVLAGNVTLTWADPPNRFDRRRIHIRRSEGATPPADSSAGTEVANVALGVNTYVDAPGVGTWSYTIFGSYTDTGAAVDERFSDGPATEEGVSTTEVVV